MATTTNTKLTAQQRAALFAQMTRQNIHPIPSQTVTAAGETMQFTLPKARLLSKITLEVSGSVKMTGTATPTLKPFAPYCFLRRIAVDANNGFSPFIVSGKELYLYNMCRVNADSLAPSANDERAVCYMPAMTASSSGKSNAFKFSIDIPITLNQRDPVGFILLQNMDTAVTCTVDVCNNVDFTSTAGITAELEKLTVTPIIETFTLPAVQEAFPDISVLKLVNSKTENFSGDVAHVDLAVGTIYRKLFLYFEDNNGNALADSDFTGNIDLLFNQADTPYSVPPVYLAHKNAAELGMTLPKGVYMFDFTNQGIVGMGGSRDIIDTERLTMFQIRFNTIKAGRVTVISEKVTRLK